MDQCEALESAFNDGYAVALDDVLEQLAEVIQARHSGDFAPILPKLQLIIDEFKEI